MNKDLLEKIQRLNAIADAGLKYGSKEFDQDRYEELKKVTRELLMLMGNLSSEEVENIFPKIPVYPTPSIDVRNFLIEDGKVLLIKDKKSKEWSLPGGYAEVGINLSDNALKELQEEAGVLGRINRLLAIFDTNKYNPQLTQYYKCVFLVDKLSMHFVENLETEEAKFFALDKLPNLSKVRNTEEQIKVLYDLYEKGETLID